MRIVDFDSRTWRRLLTRDAWQAPDGTIYTSQAIRNACGRAPVMFKPEPKPESPKRRLYTKDEAS